MQKLGRERKIAALRHGLGRQLTNINEFEIPSAMTAPALWSALLATTIHKLWQE
jgi:hypothetical protein